MVPKSKPLDPDLSDGHYWEHDEAAQRKAELNYPSPKKYKRHPSTPSKTMYFRDPPKRAPNGKCFCHGCKEFKVTAKHFTSVNFVFCVACTALGMTPSEADKVT
jgi:hypothetical protein